VKQKEGLPLAAVAAAVLLALPIPRSGTVVDGIAEGHGPAGIPTEAHAEVAVIGACAAQAQSAIHDALKDDSPCGQRETALTLAGRPQAMRSLINVFFPAGCRSLPLLSPRWHRGCGAGIGRLYDRNLE
jgi:hypothetical protein